MSLFRKMISQGVVLDKGNVFSSCLLHTNRPLFSPPSPFLFHVKLPSFHQSRQDFTVLRNSRSSTLRRRKFADELEDWEMRYEPHRFKYKDLYVATKGFKDEELLGRGGFVKVYKGVFPDTNLEIVVKKVSNESKQGTRPTCYELY